MRSALLVVLAIGIGLGVVSTEPGIAKSSSFQTPDPIVTEIIQQVDEGRLREHICQLQSREGGEYCNEDGSRWSCDASAIDRATEYARQYFENLGLKTRLVPYSLSCRPGLSYNVEAELPGAESSALVLITAHIDSLLGMNPFAMSAGQTAPGADDNASGSAAVLEAVRILSQYKFKHTIRFVLFTGEEQWMVGSSAYASEMARESAPILGVFNVDMIGYDSDDNGFFEIWVGTRPQEVFEGSSRLAELITKTIEIYELGLVPEMLDDPRRGGDQAPFWRRGYAAVMVIEDSEYGTTDDFNPGYHTAADVLRFLNLAYMKRMVQAVIGAAAQLAEPIQ